jgi:DNA-binding MarR family transcriptional regulator
MRAADLYRLARTLREIALKATEEPGEQGVSAGELAVLEDIARNPKATISAITARTGLAQSLVSRITHALADSGALTIDAHPRDKRKVQIELDEKVRALILERAGNPITDAIAAASPELSQTELKELEHHLSQASLLLGLGDARPQSGQTRGD